MRRHLGLRRQGVLRSTHRERRADELGSRGDAHPATISTPFTVTPHPKDDGEPGRKNSFRRAHLHNKARAITKRRRNHASQIPSTPPEPSPAPTLREGPDSRGISGRSTCNQRSSNDGRGSVSRPPRSERGGREREREGEREREERNGRGRRGTGEGGEEQIALILSAPPLFL